MDSTTLTLVITQSLSFILLILSETMPMPDGSPATGIIRAIIQALNNPQPSVVGSNPTLAK